MWTGENGGFQIRSPARVENFENGDVSYSCGRAKTEVFKYDDVMPTLPHIRFENATCGRRFF